MGAPEGRISDASFLYFHAGRVPVTLCSYQRTSAAEAVSVSAAAQQQKDPDDVAAASASAVRAAYVRSAVSAAAAQQKDQEDNVAAISSCRTVTSAAAVCCR